MLIYYYAFYSPCITMTAGMGGWGREQFKILCIFSVSIPFADTGHSSVNTIVFVLKLRMRNHTERQ